MFNSGQQNPKGARGREKNQVQLQRPQLFYGPHENPWVDFSRSDGVRMENKNNVGDEKSPQSIRLSKVSETAEILPIFI